jgi:hypothetical protein
MQHCWPGYSAIERKDDLLPGEAVSDTGALAGEGGQLLHHLGDTKGTTCADHLDMRTVPSGVTALEIRRVISMKTFGTQWERIRLVVTPSTFRLGLALLSLVAMVFAGAAGERWE